MDPVKIRDGDSRNVKGEMLILAFVSPTRGTRRPDSQLLYCQGQLPDLWRISTIFIFKDVQFTRKRLHDELFQEFAGDPSPDKRFNPVLQAPLDFPAFPLDGV